MNVVEGHRSGHSIFFLSHSMHEIFLSVPCMSKLLKMIFHLCIILLISYGVEAIEQCDDGWMYYDEYCYWSSYQLLAKNKSVSPIANWFGAQLYCQELGADLAHFREDFEKSLILSLVACSSSWLNLIYKVTPTEKGWVWWSTCNDASHLINKSEPNCGPHQPTTAKLDSKGIIVAEFPDVRLPFVCKRLANEVSYDCDTTTVSPHETTFTSTTETSPSTTRTSVAMTTHVTTTKTKHTTTEGEFSGEGPATMMDSPDAMDAGTGSSTTEFEETIAYTTHSRATTEQMQSTSKLSGTTSSTCNKTCSTGFLDDNAPCCLNVLNHRKIKRFYDDKTSKCYYLPIDADKPVDYFAAQLSCQENGMHLSSIHSAEQNHVVGFLSMCRNSWIGLENVKPKEVCNCHGWAWEDYSSERLNNSICTDYVHNFFDLKLVPKAPLCSQEAQCTVIYPQTVQQRNEYYWKNCYCYELHNFICVE